MPQMSPINWLMMFFMFMFTFILFNLINYFLIGLSNKMNKNLYNKAVNNNYYSWKW